MPRTNGRQPFQLPADLNSLTGEQLAKLLADAGEEVDGLLGADEQTPESEAKIGELLDAMETVAARQGEMAAEAAETAQRFDALRSRRQALNPADEADPEQPDADAQAEPDAAPADAPAGGEPELVGAGAAAAPAAQVPVPVGGAVTASRETGGLAGPRHKLNPRLGQAPRPAASAPPPEELAITASVGLPGSLEPGAKVKNWRQLAELISARAQRMVDQKGNFHQRRDGDPYGGVQVASIANRFDTTFDRDSIDEVHEYVDKLQSMRSAQKFEAEVAAGGWCAPPEVRYSFFNIAAECGAIDLPTFGMPRGSITYPESPSLADTFSPELPWYTEFSPSTVPWIWNNTMDTAAVTGFPTKPCIRVPCADMLLAELECYGLCLTAGNLTDAAWPEATRNFLRLLMAAFYHAKNARTISLMVAQSTAVASGGCFDNPGAAATFLNGAELGSRDIRTKYGMCPTDVVEWVFPEHALDIMRADLANRTGVRDWMAVPNSELANWFSARGIAAQFVADWQVRAAGQPGASTAINAWPSTFYGMAYPAGTWGLGNGMSLDLGIVRDSTLNETNDFTAAWLEECHVPVKFGHESRLYRFDTCASGRTGSANLTDCC